MYDHILVPVSYHEDRDAAGALAIARKLVNKGGRITLLHVMEEVPAYAVAYMPEDFRRQSAAAIATDLKSRIAGIAEADVAVVEGHAGRTIPEWAEAKGADCIVIASHRPGISDYFLGSTAARVVRHAKCAVHVIR